MKKCRRFKAESAINKYLPGSGCQKILSANDLGDTHSEIVHDHGQFVGWNVVPIPNEEISKIPQRHTADTAAIPVDELDLLSIGNAKSPVSAFRSSKFHSSLDRRSPFDWKYRNLSMGSQSGLRNVSSRAHARVEKSPIAKPLPCIEVDRQTTALVDGTLLPFNSQPSQIIDNRIRIVRFAAVRIEIFDPENSDSSGLDRAFEGPKECRRMPQMQMTRGRRGNPATVRKPLREQRRHLRPRCGSNADSSIGKILKQLLSLACAGGRFNRKNPLRDVEMSGRRTSSM